MTRTVANALHCASRVNNEIIYGLYTMIVINRISAGRQYVLLCEELRSRRQAQPLPAPPRCRYFTAGTRIHGRHNLSVFKYARADKFTYFNINS